MYHNAYIFCHSSCAHGHAGSILVNIFLSDHETLEILDAEGPPHRSTDMLAHASPEYQILSYGAIPSKAFEFAFSSVFLCIDDRQAYIASNHPIPVSARRGIQKSDPRYRFSHPVESAHIYHRDFHEHTTPVHS